MGFELVWQRFFTPVAWVSDPCGMGFRTLWQRFSRPVAWVFGVKTTALILKFCILAHLILKFCILAHLILKFCIFFDPRRQRGASNCKYIGLMPKNEAIVLTAPAQRSERNLRVPRMRRWPILAAAVLSVIVPNSLFAEPVATQIAAPHIPDIEVCSYYAAQAEKAWKIPPGLLWAIGMVESRRGSSRSGSGPWPWSLDAAGHGMYFDSREQAPTQSA